MQDVGFGSFSPIFGRIFDYFFSDNILLFSVYVSGVHISGPSNVLPLASLGAGIQLRVEKRVKSQIARLGIAMWISLCSGLEEGLAICNFESLGICDWQSGALSLVT